MDHGTHENATIAQQSAEAARTLESEAERLRALVSQFHLPAQGSPPRAWAA
jgi:methyl-accepting chemotaxis protein